MKNLPGFLHFSTKGRPSRGERGMEELTQKQEAFALAFVETGSASEAYRRAYDVKAATQHSTIWSSASRLLADPKVSARVKELQAMAAAMSLYTVKDALDEYEAARVLAMTGEAASPSAAVSAVNGKVKLLGLDAPQKLEHTGPGGGPVDGGASMKLAALIESIAERRGKAG